MSKSIALSIILFLTLSCNLKSKKQLTNCSPVLKTIKVPDNFFPLRIEYFRVDSSFFAVFFKDIQTEPYYASYSINIEQSPSLTKKLKTNTEEIINIYKRDPLNKVYILKATNTETKLFNVRYKKNEEKVSSYQYTAYTINEKYGFIISQEFYKGYDNAIDTFNIKSAITHSLYVVNLTNLDTLLQQYTKEYGI